MYIVIELILATTKFATNYDVKTSKFKRKTSFKYVRNVDFFFTMKSERVIFKNMIFI